MHEDVLSQKELADACSNGQRLFQNYLMQFFDVANIQLSDVTVKNSKLMFCTFRNCIFKNVNFRNCEVYFGSFYSGNISNTNFENCSISLTLFDGTQFDKTFMKNCDIRLSVILNSNSASVDTSTSAIRNFTTDISQLTPQIIEESIDETMNCIERLDIGLRLKIKEMIRQDLDRHKLNGPKHRPNPYDSETKKSDDRPLAYEEAKTLINTTFGPYATKNQSPYKIKFTYGETRL